MKKLGIIYKSEDKLIAGTAGKLASDLAPSFKVILQENKMKDTDVILTLGGDGTILRAARTASLYNIPLLAVHLGGLGLLTEISLQDISGAIEKIRRKKFMLDERAMLEALILRNGRGIRRFIALNDIVIGKREISRTIKLRAFMGNLLLSEYVSDGLIAATPTGSTAYNFAVMGPVIPPQSKSYILSPICPHRAANRSVVLEKPCSIESVKNEEVLLTADGQETFLIKPTDRINISIAREKTSFIRFKEYNLWELLRQKLGWQF